MARVIVILALMLAITAAMFALTRKAAVSPGEAATGPSTTVPLGDLPKDEKDDAKDSDTASLTSVDPRTPSTVETVAIAETPPSAASAQDVTKGPVEGAAPSFGTAGIDHKGNASFTGTATPGDVVALLSDGKQMGTTKADTVGNWSISFKARGADTEQQLVVSAQGKDGATVIGPQRALIRPPATLGGLPRITLKAADQSATTLQEGNVTAPEAKTGLVIEKVSSGDSGLTLLTGKADPGATLRVAINGKPAGETRVSQDGTWSLAASNASGKSARSLRLELVDKDGATLDRADVPYKVAAAAPKVASNENRVTADFPSVPTSKPERKPRPKPERKKEELAALTAPGTSLATDQPHKRTVIRVRRGDSLWRIARRHLGKGKKWAAFYKANKEKIDNPDLIYPGQILVLPS